MTDTALTVQDNRMTFDEATRASVAFAKSGFFKDATDAAQAVVKILAGQELGIGPVAAMRGISFIMGKLNLDAGLVSALIKRSGRYDYKVVENSDKAAQLDFYDRGAKVGTSRFTLDDAKAAGLLGKDLWAKYPRNMLFARALSNGAKWYAPDVFYGAVYTADELDDNATVPAIAVEVAEPTNVHKPEAADVEAPFTEEPAEQEHWIKQEKVRKYFWGKAKELGFANQRQVHAALHIEHMEEWAGTVEEAVAGLEQMIADTKARLP